MIPRELIRQIRRIEIRTNRMVNDVLAGEYHSVFKGQGVEFEEVREYQFGDDIRSIDWNVTARMGEPFIKRYREERELTVMLLVDLSSSSRFGAVEKTKSEVAAELSAVLAFSAIKNNDRVGLILFTDEVKKFIPPQKGKKHVLRLVRDLLTFESPGGLTDIKCALDFLGKVAKRKSVVFLISDFLGDGYENALRVANARHDLIAISVADPREAEMPPVGFIELEDAETGERILFDTFDAIDRNRFAQIAATENAQLTESLKRMRVDHVSIRTGQSYIDPLVKLFQQRSRRY